MGCANQRLHTQQIAYQRDFLGACWNSAFGDEEATEYTTSRWMGISQQVMGLRTKNHCFIVRTLREDTASEATASHSKVRSSARGQVGVGEITKVSASAGTSANASPLHRDPVSSSNLYGPLAARAGPSPASPSGALSITRASSPSITCTGATHEGQHHRNSYPPAAAHKASNTRPRAIRRVVKNAIELEKISHSHHPYLQYNELSVYSGVVFRCAPANRWYNHIALVPEARARWLNSAPQSTGLGRRIDSHQKSESHTPFFTSSDVAASGEGSRGQAEVVSAVSIDVFPPAYPSSTSEGDWSSGDPLSASNNYPMDDHDAEGVSATRQPVVVGSITAMELLALPPNAELCFGGWLYVSLQDEQDRLRRSLAQYEAQRQWRAAMRQGEAATAPANPSRSWSLMSDKNNANEVPQESKKKHDGAERENVSQAYGVVDDPYLGSSVPAQAASASWQSGHRDVGGREDCSKTLAADRKDEVYNNTVQAAFVHVDVEATSPCGSRETRHQRVKDTPQRSTAESGENTPPPPTRAATTLPSPQLHAPRSMVESSDLFPSTSHAPASSVRRTNMTLSVSSSTPCLNSVRRTGKYAQEAMETDALKATWLPHAYVIIAVPMYECSLVPTAFHTTSTRCKAVSLNLADAQSREMYGVGCITAVRYGGVMVVEYREKINEADDAAWIEELLRVGRVSQQKCGGAGNQSNDTNINASVCLPVSASHRARDAKLDSIKARICRKLRRHGLYVVLASTRMADRQHRRQRAPMVNESSMMVPTSASFSEGVYEANASAHPGVGVGGNSVAPLPFRYAATGEDYDRDTVYNASGSHNAVEDDSSESTSSSSSSSKNGTAVSRRGGGGGGGERRRSLWSNVSSRGRRQHRRRHHHRGGQQRGLTSALRDQCLWAEPHLDDDDDDDFLLRGTFRQIGGMKYVDALSLMDGCPVSELIHGIKRWVIKLLSMPIKARPLSLYLQRYEGIASSLQLLSTQLEHTTNAYSAHFITPGNISFDAGGGTRVEDTASFVSQQQETTRDVLNTGNFTVFATQTTPHGVPYNTYYRGPLDPIVQTLLSPEVEARIAACRTTQSAEHLRAQTPTSTLAVTSDSTTSTMPLSPPRSAGAAFGSARSNANKSDHTPLTSRTRHPPLGCIAIDDKISAAPAEGEVSHRAFMSSAGMASLRVHNDPLSPPPLNVTLSASASPRTVGAPKPKRILADPPEEVRALSAAPPSGIPTTITECLLYDTSSRNSSLVGHSFTVASGRAWAAVAVTRVPSSRTDQAVEDDATSLSLTALSHNTSPICSKLLAKKKMNVDLLVASSAVQRDSKRAVMPSSKGGEAGNGTSEKNDTVSIERSRCIGGSVGSLSFDPLITPHELRRSRPRVGSGLPAISAAETRFHENEKTDLNGDSESGSGACQGASGGTWASGEAKGVSHIEREWQLADCELRALKLDLDEMHRLVSSARSELLERLEESVQLSAIFLPHTRTDKVELSLLTLKMLRQFPEEVPVKEIHADWVPILMSLLTTPHNHIFCCAGNIDDDAERSISDTSNIVKTYNRALPQSHVGDVNKCHDLYDAGAPKYTIGPLPTLPAPRPLHDIVIAPQPIRFLKAAPHPRGGGGGMGETWLPAMFSGGSFGVLAGVLYYYADFLRAKYRSAVAAAGGQPKQAGATVQDVLARDGYNVLLRRIWIWGAVPELKKQKSCLTSVAAKARDVLQGKPNHDGEAQRASPAGPAWLTRAAHHNCAAMNTTSLDTGSVPIAWHPFRGAEAYALYDAVAHYLRTLDELHTEHEGREVPLAPQLPSKHHSLQHRPHKDRAHVATTGNASGAKANCATGGGTAAPLEAGGDLVPHFEICMATNYYYIEMMEEAQRPRAPRHRSSALPRTCRRTSAQERLTAATSTSLLPSPSSSAASRAKSTRQGEKAAAQQRRLEKPYCGGEEGKKGATDQHAVKKTLQFLTVHYEQWRTQYCNDHTTSALAKRIHLSAK